MGNLQNILVDTSHTATKTRKDAAIAGTLLNVAGTVAEVACTIMTVIGLFKLNTYPITSFVAVISGVCGSLFSREISFVGRNLENMMTSNFFERILYASTAESFTQALTKDTYVLSRFSKTLALQLEYSY